MKAQGHCEARKELEQIGIINSHGIAHNAMRHEVEDEPREFVGCFTSKGFGGCRQGLPALGNDA
jgi:hypothetical protein